MKYYKNKYFIVFYDKTDENLQYIFNNVKDILKFKNKEINKQNINLLNVELYRALNSEFHFTRCLNGEVMRVYIINVEEDEENE